MVPDTDVRTGGTLRLHLTMGKIPVVSAFTLAALLAPGSAAQQLPPDIQVDRLLVQAEREIEDGDHASAALTFERILSICEEHGLAIPVEFWFRQAGVLQGAGLHEGAIEASTRYLQEAGRQGEHYRTALEILDQAEVDLAAARRAKQQVSELEAAAGPFIDTLNNHRTSCDTVLDGLTSRDPDFPVTITTVAFASLDAHSCHLAISEYSSVVNRPDGSVRWESSSQADLTIRKGQAVSLFLWDGEADAEPGSCRALPSGRVVFATAMVSSPLIKDEFRRDVVRERIDYANGDTETGTTWFFRLRPPVLTDSEIADLFRSVRRTNALCVSRFE